MDHYHLEEGFILCFTEAETPQNLDAATKAENVPQWGSVTSPRGEPHCGQASRTHEIYSFMLCKLNHLLF